MRERSTLAINLCNNMNVFKYFIPNIYFFQLTLLLVLEGGEKRRRIYFKSKCHKREKKGCPNNIGHIHLMFVFLHLIDNLFLDLNHLVFIYRFFFLIFLVTFSIQKILVFSHFFYIFFWFFLLNLCLNIWKTNSLKFYLRYWEF